MEMITPEAIEKAREERARQAHLDALGPAFVAKFNRLWQVALEQRKDFIELDQDSLSLATAPVWQIGWALHSLGFRFNSSLQPARVFPADKPEPPTCCCRRD